MRQRQENAVGFYHRQPLRTQLDASPYQSSSMLLPAIKDQQIYLSLASTFLTLAKEAGASIDSLHQVGRALLTAKGLDTSRMLQNSNQDQSQYHSRGLTYNWLQKGCSSLEMKNLVQKMEKEMVDARQKQKQFRCLQKYRRQKEEQIAPSFSSNSGTKKDRFKRIVKSKYNKKSIQSSNFYQFDVKQILHNSFKAQNECYKTISSFVHLKTMYGHSAEQDNQCYTQVYNAIFDKSQKFIITGGQEGMIKVWHKDSGTLVKTLRGHTDYICKIDISNCNKYLMSSAGDGIRFFDLRNLKPLGGWLRENPIDQITSFIDENGRNIFVFGENSELYLLPEEVMLANTSRRLQVEHFTTFSFSQLIEKDNASIIVISLSPQKTHLIIGLQTGQFLLVEIASLQEVMRRESCGQKFTLPSYNPIKAHYKEIVQIKWSENSFLWATGGKDGRCCLWELKGDQIVLINTLNVNRGQKGRKKHSYACTYICWNCTYSHFAAGFQQCIEDEEESNERGRGQVLVYSLKQQRITYQLSKDISLNLGGIKAMDSHPTYPNILLICQAQGYVFLLDLFLGCVINVFEERGYHIMHPQFRLIPTECRFTQDGLYFIVSSELGSVSLYGYDSKMFYALSPTEQFLQTDFTAIEIEQNSMKAISLTLNFNDDINNYPAGPILTIKGQPYQNIIKIDLQPFLYCINNPPQVRSHLPQIMVHNSFLSKIAYSLREGAFLEISYQKTYEQIQQNKQMTLFHERERQYAKITSITNSKYDSFKHQPHLSAEQQNRAYIEDQEPIIRSRTRKLKRHTQIQRINYADDFSYHDSQEEDFNIIEQQLPEEISESSSSPEDQEPRSRLRRRERTRIRRQTRQTNPIRYNQPEELEQNEQRMPTRSKNHHQSHHQNQQQEQIEEDNSQVILKKRIKQENESYQSQPKKYSRLRKHQSQQNEQAIDCYRCQLVKATQICDRCRYSQQFCYQCSSMRGKRIRDKFKCLICLFLDNEGEQQYQSVNEQPYRVTSRSKDIYLPQLQDQVRFFFQGYEQFIIQNIHKLNNSITRNNSQFRLLPHTQDLQLLNAPLCKVKTIEYYFPVKGTFENNTKRNPGKGESNPILMLLGLEKLNNILTNQINAEQQMNQELQNEQKDQQNIFWVYFVPAYDFLIPNSIYLQIEQKKLISKFVNNQLIQLKDEQMQIIEISPFEDRYPQSIWKLLKIRKTEGKRLRGNTKEIQRRINLWRATEQIQYQTEQCMLQRKYADRLIERLQILLKEDSPFCIFIDYVDLQIYPLYRHQVPVGICLQAIYQRVKNNYYISEQSLKADFDRIYNNSLAFNGQNHNVTQSASELRNILYSLLSQEEISLIEAPIEEEHKQQPQLPSHSKKTQEQSNSKKDKKKKDSEQYIDPAFTVTEKRRTRRDNQSRNTNKQRRRQRDSSDYEQKEVSLDEEVGVSTRGGRGRTYYEEQPKRITRSRNKNV